MLIKTDEEKQFIFDNVEGKTAAELTEMYNNKFNKELTVKQIQEYKRSHKLKSGINTKFYKNQVPHNYKPVGSEFVFNGYTFIKIKDPNTWVLKHRYLYEKVNGKIPSDSSVIFADGDKTNFNIDNLMLVKRKEKLIMKNKHLFYECRELTETGALIAKLISKTSEARNRR